MKKVDLLVVGSFIGMSCSLFAQNWTPDAAIIRQIEAQVNRTKTMDPVNTYARYYAGYTDNGKRMVASEFVSPALPGEQSAGIYIVRSETQFPQGADRGCAAVYVHYSVDDARIVSQQCESTGVLSSDPNIVVMPAPPQQNKLP